MPPRFRTALLSGLLPLLVLAWAGHTRAESVLPRLVDRQSSEKAVGVVESINLDNRIVTIRALGRDQAVVMEVGDEVRNLDQVKVGDRVVVEYHEALAVDLVKGGGMQPTGGAATAVARAAEGEKPAAGAGELIELVATIVGIDRSEPSVTLQGPKGNIVEVLVREPAKLEQVDVGDQIIVTMVRAVAISLHPAPVGGAQ